MRIAGSACVIGGFNGAALGRTKCRVLLCSRRTVPGLLGFEKAKRDASLTSVDPLSKLIMLARFMIDVVSPKGCHQDRCIQEILDHLNAPLPHVADGPGQRDLEPRRSWAHQNDKPKRPAPFGGPYSAAARKGSHRFPAGGVRGDLPAADRGRPESVLELPAGRSYRLPRSCAQRHFTMAFTKK
jgi:hypothetical protein